MPLQDNFSMNIYFTSSISTTMTSQDASVVEFPIASTRLRSLSLKKHISTLYNQLTQEKKADPHLTRMILLNMFQIFQINKISSDTSNYINIPIHSFKIVIPQLRRSILLSNQSPSLETYPIECVCY